MGGDHGYTGSSEQGVSRRWVLTSSIQEGRAGSIKEMGVNLGYTGRVEPGVSRRWVVTLGIQGVQSREYQGDGC